MIKRVKGAHRLQKHAPRSTRTTAPGPAINDGAARGKDRDRDRDRDRAKNRDTRDAALLKLLLPSVLGRREGTHHEVDGLVSQLLRNFNGDVRGRWAKGGSTCTNKFETKQSMQQQTKCNSTQV